MPRSDLNQEKNTGFSKKIIISNIAVTFTYAVKKKTKIASMC